MWSFHFMGRSHSMLVTKVSHNFSLSRNFARPLDQMVMWLHGQNPIKISYHPARFGSYAAVVVEI